MAGTFTCITILSSQGTYGEIHSGLWWAGVNQVDEVA